MRYLFLFILFAACARTGRTQVPPAFAERWDAVVAAYEARLDSAGIVGSSLYVVHEGEAVGRAYYGYADRDLQTPVDEHTIFHWASITKTLTGVAFMQLVERGRVAPADPVVRYVPELGRVSNPYGRVDDVTFDHLLTHTSGFRGATWPWGDGAPWQPYEPTEWSQLVAMMPYTQLEFRPGTRYSYSNPGITFVGRTIETLTGDDIEVYLTKNILMPLSMHESYFDTTPYYLSDRRSNSYYIQDDSLWAEGRDFDTGVTVGNGGLNAPVTDLVRWTNFLLGVGDVERYAFVLDRKRLEAMWRPRLPTEETDAYVEHIGQIFFIIDQEVPGRAAPIRAVGHTGSQHGFRAFILLHPGTGFAAVMVMNTMNMDPAEPPYANATDAVLYETRRDVLQKIVPLFMATAGPSR